MASSTICASRPSQRYAVRDSSCAEHRAVYRGDRFCADYRAVYRGDRACAEHKAVYRGDRSCAEHKAVYRGDRSCAEHRAVFRGDRFCAEHRAVYRGDRACAEHKAVYRGDRSCAEHRALYRGDRSCAEHKVVYRGALTITVKQPSCAATALHSSRRVLVCLSGYRSGSALMEFCLLLLGLSRKTRRALPFKSFPIHYLSVTSHFSCSQSHH